MNDAVQVALIVSIAPTLTAIAGVVISMQNRSRLQVLHIDLNSRLSQLLEAHGSSERAEGIEEGRRIAADEGQSRVTESERLEDRRKGVS